MLNENVEQLEVEWREHEFDNYKDILSSCSDLVEATKHSDLAARVLVVVAGIIAELEELADPVIDTYLGDWAMRTYWEQLAGRRLPAP